MPSTGVALKTEVLRAARIRKGLSPRDIQDRCEELGTPVSYTTYQRCEQGTTRPYPRTLRAIALALEVDVDELIASAA